MAHRAKECLCLIWNCWLWLHFESVYLLYLPWKTGSKLIDIMSEINLNFMGICVIIAFECKFFIQGLPIEAAFLSGKNKANWICLLFSNFTTPPKTYSWFREAWFENQLTPNLSLFKKLTLQKEPSF